LLGKEPVSTKRKHPANAASKVTDKEKTAIPQILIVANIMKSLNSRSDSSVGVTFATTKSKGPGQ
jgi:hypothetical protein